MPVVKSMRELVEEAVRKMADEHATDYHDDMYHFWPFSFDPDETEGFLKNVNDEILFNEYNSAMITIHQ